MPNSQIRLACNLMLPLDAITEKFAILGNPGMGKSAVATTFVEQLYRADLPVVVIDVKGDWWGIRSSKDGKSEGMTFVVFGGEHGDLPLEPTAGALIADTIVDYRLWAILDLSLMSKTKARRFATAFAEQLYLRNRDPLMVVVDEADVLIPQRADAETARLIGAMEDIAKRGRGRGLGLTIASQRGQEVNKSVLDIMGNVILLGMTGRLTIKAVSEWISVNAASDEVSASEVIGSLPSLKVGEAWFWSPMFMRMVKRVDLAMFTTFDSKATPKAGERRVVPVRRAAIDLAKLSAEIAATVERAKAADPKALQYRVAVLERQAAELAREKQALIDEVANLRAVEPEVIEVPAVLPEELLAGIRQSVQAADAALEAAQLARDSVHEAGLLAVRAQAERPAPRTTPARPEKTGWPLPARPSAPNRPEPTPAPADAATGSGPGIKLPKAQRSVLSALAPYAPRPRSKRQVAMLTGYSGRGGGFNNALSALRSGGYIEGTGDAIGITSAGLDALGEYTPLPTGQELLEHWLGQLARAPRLILETLAAAWPEPLSKDEVAEQAGYEPAGGGFNNALSRLRTLELIAGSGTALRASDDLMDQS